MRIIVLAFVAWMSVALNAQAETPRVSDTDIVNAYEYMMGRWLVLRQETLDVKEGLKWNEFTHRKPGGVQWANPNLDVAYSEAWIAVDETSCTLIDLPKIKRRYYTVQVMNGWAEVVANINERNYPKHPSGIFALCLKGSKVALPAGAQRIDLSGKKSRVLMRIELGANEAEAIALQQRTTMKATGHPKVDDTVVKMTFDNDKLLGVAAFDQTDLILASDPDINPGMAEPQRMARMVAKAATDPAERARIDEVIHKQAIPAVLKLKETFGTIKDGWIHPRPAGNFGSDYRMRALTNLVGIWANNSKEVTYYGVLPLNGSVTYLQTYPKQALPQTKVRYFWSVIVVDSEKFQVIPNSLNRYLLNEQSGLQFNADGSLTLAFAPKLPKGVPSSNWLPTPEGKMYNMTYRFYGPTPDVVDATYYPPPLVKK